MKKTLFASTAAAAMLAAGYAAAETNVTVFGDARLGLGYNVVNAGGGIVEADDDDADEVRAVSRVRFGVRLTGETDTGITFGGTIRADNATPGGTAGTAGNVFASGAFGTLTMGDTAGAHQQHIGDLPAVGLTALGDRNEFLFQGNRAPGGADYRPTVRYDFDFAGFGISVSTGRELEDIAVGASFSPQFAGGAFSIGGGYFFGDDDAGTEDQWGVGLTGGFAGFNGQVVYLDTDGDDGFREIGVGLGTNVADIGLNAYYKRALSGDVDGNDMFGVGFTFNLGNGASLRGGVARVYDGGNDYSGDRVTAADFGINMAF
jgi:outer membrane protein OmpU